MNNSVVCRGATRCEVNYLNCKNSNTAMLENETETVFYLVKIFHVLIRTEKNACVLLSFVRFLAGFLNQLGHRKQARWVFECEKQETSSACQRPSCKRVSCRLTVANTCIQMGLSCMAVCSERATKSGAQVCSSDQACLSTAAWGLFYKATCPAMADENTSQNGISDWSLFHRTTSD